VNCDSGLFGGIFNMANYIGQRLANMRTGGGSVKYFRKFFGFAVFNPLSITSTATY
jgi:hypothetical protein